MRDHVVTGLANIFDRAVSVRVNNVMNPMLWLTAVGMPVSFVAAYFAGFDSTAGILLAALGALPLLIGCATYVWFALRHPDRLQSEEYLLRQRELLILSKHGDARPTSDADAMLDPLAVEEPLDRPRQTR